MTPSSPKNTPPSDSLGSRLRRARRARLFTQVALAERSGVEQATISRVETGAQMSVEADTLRRLASTLGATEEWLGEGHGEAPAALQASARVENASDRIVAIDDLLDGAFVPGRHKPTGIAYLRTLLHEHIHEVVALEDPSVLVEPARLWLDAIDVLREAGRPVTLIAVLLRASIMPSHAPPKASKPRSGNARATLAKKKRE